jgi:hypothetical protein
VTIALLTLLLFVLAAGAYLAWAHTTNTDDGDLWEQR